MLPATQRNSSATNFSRIYDGDRDERVPAFLIEDGIDSCGRRTTLSTAPLVAPAMVALDPWAVVPEGSGLEVSPEHTRRTRREIRSDCHRAYPNLVWNPPYDPGRLFLDSVNLVLCRLAYPAIIALK